MDGIGSYIWVHGFALFVDIRKDNNMNEHENAILKEIAIKMEEINVLNKQLAKYGIIPQFDMSTYYSIGDETPTVYVQFSAKKIDFWAHD